MKRNSYHHGDLKSALFKACHKLLRKTDPQEISLRQVADLAGVSHTAIYRHFKNREQLLEVMACYGFERLAHIQKRAFDKESSNEEGLIRLGLAYIKFATNHPHYYKIMFMTKREHPSFELKRSQVKSYLVLLNSCKTYLVSKKILKDPRVYALMCWSLVHGYSNLTIETTFPKSEAATIKTTSLSLAEAIIRNALI